jgi:hypothetical protein
MISSFKLPGYLLPLQPIYFVLYSAKWTCESSKHASLGALHFTLEQSGNLFAAEHRDLLCICSGLLCSPPWSARWSDFILISCCDLLAGFLSLLRRLQIGRLVVVIPHSLWCCWIYKFIESSLKPPLYLFDPALPASWFIPSLSDTQFRSFQWAKLGYHLMKLGRCQLMKLGTSSQDLQDVILTRLRLIR